MTGVQISRGVWKAFEACPAANISIALATLRARHADWWKPGDPPQASFGTDNGPKGHFTVTEKLDLGAFNQGS